MKKAILLILSIIISITSNAQIRYRYDGKIVIGNLIDAYHTGTTTSFDISIKNNGFMAMNLNKGFGVDLHTRNNTVVWHFGGNGDLVFRNWTTNTYSVLAATNFIFASDQNLKKDITPFSGGLEVISQLRPVSYKFINDPQKNDKAYSQYMKDNTNVGLLAQDLESVLPALVHISDDDTKFVDYISLISVLIDAVQTLESEIVDLREQLDNIKTH